MASEEDGRPLYAGALSGAAWLMSGRVVQALLRLIVLGVLARFLEPAEIGLAGAGMLVIALFRVFLSTGISPAVVQRPGLSELHVRVAFSVSIIIGCALGALIILTADDLARLSFGLPRLAEILVVIGWLLPLQSIGIVSQALIERRMGFSTIVRIDLLAYLSYGAVGIGLAQAQYGVWSLVYAFIVESSVRTVLSMSFERHSLRPSLHFETARELLFFSAGFSLGRMGNFVGVNGDNWVVGRWLGEQALGYYKYAFELTAMVSTLIGGVLDRVLFPTMARIQGDRARISTAYLRGVALIAILIAPLSSALIVLAPELIEVALGPGWDAAVAPFRVLAVVLLLRGTYKVSDSIARATGAVYQRAALQLVYASSVVGFSWVGHHWGLAGVAAGASAGVLINAAVMAGLTMHLTGLRWRDVLRAHAGPLPCFVLSLLVNLGCAHAIRGFGLPPVLVALSAIGGGVVILIPLILRFPGFMLGRHGAAATRQLLVQVIALAPGMERLPGLQRVIREEP